MTTAREYLDRYNVAATILNRPTIKSWKASTAAIQVKTNAIEIEVKNLEAANKAVEENKAINAKLTKKTATKKSTKSNDPSAASVLKEFDIAPKLGRALLRKHNVERTPAAIRAFFQARKK